MAEPGLYFQGFGGCDNQVAGSKYKFILKRPDDGIEAFLQDCGSEMQDDVDDHNTTVEKAKLLFRADNLNGVVISHGHFDHVGDIWKLIVNGYRGPYYATEPSRELTLLQLTDQSSFEWYKFGQSAKERAKGEKNDAPRPMFGRREIKQMTEVFHGLKYGQRFGVTDNIDAVFYDAGHIIGSAQVLYTINNNGKRVKVLTCVDLGRGNIDVPIIKRPHTDFPNDIDYALIEATYGGRLHQERQRSREELEELVQRAYKEKKGILMGAFAIMRTHQILSDLFWIYKRGNLPKDFRIYLDSPTAHKIDGIIKRHPECFDDEARADFENPKENPFKFPNIMYVSTKAKSQQLDSLEPPYMIMASSGMFSMGRIVGHLKSLIGRDDVILVGTGYQAPNTTGFQLEQGNDTIKIEGEEFMRRAEYFRMRGYGAHADGEDCVNHIVKNVKPRKGVLIVHGEEEPSQWTYDELKKSLNPNVSVEIVRKGRTYNLLPYLG